MALGWHLIRLGRHTAIFKSGLTFGSTTDAAFIPDLKLGIAVFINGVAAVPTMTRMGLELLAPIVEELSRPPIPDDSAEQMRDWSVYEGTYAWSLMQLAVEVKTADGRLTVATDTGIGVDTAVLAPLGNHRFRIEGSSAAGDIATFELDESGQARRLHFGPYSFEREEQAT